MSKNVYEQNVNFTPFPQFKNLFDANHVTSQAHEEFAIMIVLSEICY